MPKPSMNIRIDPVLLDGAKKAAAADGRSLTSWVSRLIAAALAKKP